MFESTPYNYEFSRNYTLLPIDGLRISEELGFIPVLGVSFEQRAVVDECGRHWVIYNIDGVEFTEEECETLSWEKWVSLATDPYNSAEGTFAIDPNLYRDYLDGLQRLDFDIY